MTTMHEATITCVAEDGGTAFVALPHGSSMGGLYKVSVYQLDGTMDGFSVNVFTSRFAEDPTINSLSSSSSSAGSGTELPLAALRALHKVLPTQSVAAPNAELQAFGDWMFRNTEGSNTEPVLKIYLEIDPGGSGQKQFAVRFGVWHDRNE